MPARNEVLSLEQLVGEIASALDALGGDGDIWIVDDGSEDGSVELLHRLMAFEPRLHLLATGGRRGQSAALALGFDAATGEVVVTLDGDLQNDAREAPLLVAALGAADLACGVRVGRKDSRWRRFSSRFAYRVRNFFLHDRARDTGCGLKAFRASTLRKLVRFDGWHRFFPALAQREGLRVVEVEVSHRPRLHGRTNYGTLDRAWRSVFDVVGMVWLINRRLQRGGGEATSCPPARPHNESSTRP